jgi:N-acetylglutamate synthase-like GNAT family acetyltransferase
MSQADIRDMTVETIFEYGFCGIKSFENEGCRRKAEWYKKRLSEGMRYKVLYTEEKGTIGMLEYIPGEFAWRAVKAPRYMVIHCLCIFSKNFREKGHGSRMIDVCVEDAHREKKQGVAVVTRKGPWMVGKNLFVKKGFDVVDRATPDFELLVLKFAADTPSPRFKNNRERILKQYSRGLTILWSDQCPYIAKSVKEMNETIAQRYGIKARIIEMENAKQAQNAPSPYAIFNLIYNGELLAFHPISNTRFKNIMDKVLE